MRITLTPENDMERQNYKEVVHEGVREFFMFGNKLNEETGPEDFQDWKSGYRYLIGSLSFFLNQIKEECNAKARTQNGPEMDIKPITSKNNMPQPKMIRNGDVNNIKVIDTKEIEDKIKVVKPTNAVQFDDYAPPSPVLEKDITTED